MEEKDKCEIKLTNRFIVPSNKEKQGNLKLNASNLVPIKIHQITPVVHNISRVTLNFKEISLLEKGLNYCHSTKDIDKEEYLDDIHFYCRNLRLKEHFNRDKFINDEAISDQSKKCEDLNTSIDQSGPWPTKGYGRICHI